MVALGGGSGCQGFNCDIPNIIAFVTCSIEYRSLVSVENGDVIFCEKCGEIGITHLAYRKDAGTFEVQICVGLCGC